METAVQPEGRAGKLTIFAGYMSGIGTAAAMLRAADRARQSGTDVVAGAAISCECPEARSFEGLWQAENPERLDLDAALRRKPGLLLVENLAYRNQEGRHKKRHQDVEELLNAGIDVFTTLDIPHLESLQDRVAAILGSPVSDRIPDRVFDQADRVELVDMDPRDLREQLGDWDAAPTLTQLSALRELAFRRCADRISQGTREGRQQAEYRAGEHILVCLSSAASNAKIIRTAARMAGAFCCPFTALFVETGDFSRMAAQDRDRLRANIHLAQQLGASIETVYGDDIPDQIAEFARVSGVTKIVLGRSGIAGRMLFRRPLLTEKLIALLPELDIHIIPDSGGGAAPPRWSRPQPPSLPLRDLTKSAGLLLLATLIGWLFYHLGFTEANIITVYILSVMLIAIATRRPICSFLSSVASVLIFNFFFTEPRLSLHAYDSSYAVTFLIMFAAAWLTGSLAARLKALAQKSAQVAWRTRVLFETNQSLQRAKDRPEILNVSARQLVKLFQRDVVVYQAEHGELAEPLIVYAEDSRPSDVYVSEQERQVARWVLNNNRRAGAATETFADSRCLYLSIRTGETIYGVVGVAAGEKPLDDFESSLLLSVLGECALAMENQKNAEEKEAAAVLAKNEQLRANLLRSISHDLRTPLTSISGNASNLLSNGKLFDEETKERMYADIYDDAMWLINLVENLLSVSRIEEGRMNLRLSTELMDEVVSEALRHVNRRKTEYHLSVRSSVEYLLVQIDARLIVQVLINMIDNAIKYTPPGSEIIIELKRKGKFVYVSVADNGPGIPDEAKPHVFDMFYSASNRVADSRRSLGLGLALCKSIIHAHNGEITVADNEPHGAIFTFSVPAGEVELHE